ncbi:MAG: BamA/TamA family outer membrane protein, partial [Polyangiaceae bacterium]
MTSGDPAKFFQWQNQEVRVRVINRFLLRRPVDLVVAPSFQYVAPRAYEGSRLDLDEHQPRNARGNPAVRGLRELALATMAVGLLYDSRDNEFFPRRGGFHQIAQKYIQAFPLDADVRYGDTSAFFATYVPLGPIVFAARVLVDFLYGKVPFYELISGGPFISYDMVGGAQGVRGVPQGRYNGLIKGVANAELRAMYWHFKVFGLPFKVGSDIFFDTGRVWEDYSFNSPRDGKGVGLKWGAGGGMYLQWGDAALFRIEAAYSPDAAAVSPGFPLGVYVSDSVMF